MASTQVRNALYKLEVDPKDTKHVIVHKLDANFMPLGEPYHISINPTFTFCSCLAHTSDCRHQKMYRLWNEHQVWGKGFLYCYDRKMWIPPTNPE